MGILKIAKKEALIDHFIEEVEKPNEMKSIIESWLEMRVLNRMNH